MRRIITISLSTLAIGGVCGCLFTWGLNKSHTHVYFTPGTDCQDKIIEHINNATRIDVAVYMISNYDIIDAMDAAQKRGATVRVITDYNQSAKRDAIKKMRELDIAVVTNPATHGFMHNKFAIFDNRVVMTGSYNWTGYAVKNRENCVFTDQNIDQFRDEFNNMWSMYVKYGK